MSSFSTRALTLLSSVFGACGLLLVGVAVSTDYWLLMEEGIVLQQNQTTEVKMALHSGLWRVCFVAGRSHYWWCCIIFYRWPVCCWDRCLIKNQTAVDCGVTLLCIALSWLWLLHQVLHADLQLNPCASVYHQKTASWLSCGLFAGRPAVLCSWSSLSLHCTGVASYCITLPNRARHWNRN